jgi:hypothetical protein
VVTRFIWKITLSDVKRKSAEQKGSPFTTPPLPRQPIQKDTGDSSEDEETVQDMEASAVLKEGWLEIKTLAVWNKYWFELKNGALCFYRHPKV